MICSFIWDPLLQPIRPIFRSIRILEYLGGFLLVFCVCVCVFCFFGFVCVCVILVFLLGWFLFVLLQYAACGILVLQLGIETKAPALRVLSPNHCAAREFLGVLV